jgi:hypothetical protein
MGLEIAACLTGAAETREMTAKAKRGAMKSILCYILPECLSLLDNEGGAEENNGVQGRSRAALKELEVD